MGCVPTHMRSRKQVKLLGLVYIAIYLQGYISCRYIHIQGLYSYTEWYASVAGLHYFQTEAQVSMFVILDDTFYLFPRLFFYPSYAFCFTDTKINMKGMFDEHDCRACGKIGKNQDHIIHCNGQRIWKY